MRCFVRRASRREGGRRRRRAVRLGGHTSADRPQISFDLPGREALSVGWWKGNRRDVTAEDVARAVRIAGKNSTVRLQGNDVDEALGWPSNELDAVTAAITALARTELESDEQLVRCLLALGCSKPKLQVVLTDWVASVAPELAAARSRLQLLLEQKDSLQFERRSAFEFLIDLCAQSKVDLGIDTAAVDVALKSLPAEKWRPLGIPPSHWWWRQGLLRNWDPYDD